MTKLKTKLKFCLPITYFQVKAGLARASGPDLHDLTQAAEEERLLCVVEGGVHVLSLLIKQNGSHSDNLNRQKFA